MMMPSTYIATRSALEKSRSISLASAWALSLMKWRDTALREIPISSAQRYITRVYLRVLTLQVSTSAIRRDNASSPASAAEPGRSTSPAGPRSRGRVTLSLEVQRLTKPPWLPCQRTLPAERPGCFGPATDSAAIISSCSTNCRDIRPSKSSIDSCACPIIDRSGNAAFGLAISKGCSCSAVQSLFTICDFGDCPLRVDFFMVVELSSVQVEDVKNPHSGPSTASTTNSTFNYGRDILVPETQKIIVFHRINSNQETGKIFA